MSIHDGLATTFGTGIIRNEIHPIGAGQSAGEFLASRVDRIEKFLELDKYDEETIQRKVVDDTLLENVALKEELATLKGINRHLTETIKRLEREKRELED